MATYYVATNGSDARTTVEAQNINTPWASWGKAMTQAVAGDTVYIRGGTYTAMQGTIGQWAYGARTYNKQGNAGAWINFLAYNNEVPILDCASLANIDNYHMGIYTVYSSYIKYKGLTIANVRESAAHPTSYTAAGWGVEDCDHITFENCVVTGSVQGFTVNLLVTNITYLNCDAHHNWDIYNGGDLCNGFSGNSRLGSTISYIGCRAWYNCDDGFDNAGGVGIYTYDKCWAWKNGPWHGGDSGGQGEGFKLGWSVNGEREPTQPARLVTNCISAENLLLGFNDGGEADTYQNMWFFNNSAFKNGTQNFGFGQDGYATFNVVTARNNLAYTPGIAYNNWRNCQYRSTTIQSNNTWNNNYNLTDNSFESLDVTQLERPRKADGSLPDITFLHVKQGVLTIGAGTNVGLLYDGEGKAYANPPSIGAFEYGTTPSNPTVIIEGQTFANGTDVRQPVVTNLIFRNNLVTGVTAGNYMLLAGNEAPSSGDNKEDGEVITGNMFDWNGGDTGVECIQAGYNINQIFKYNYFDSPTYGIVLKSGNNSTGNMNNVSGVVAYNIFKNTQMGVRVKGYNGAQIYNNTFYDNVHANVPAQIYITNNPDNGVAPSINTKIKNNIFYSTNNICFISIEAGCETGFESDYNIFFAAAGSPVFSGGRTFAQWRALGYDAHSVLLDPSFINNVGLVPANRLNNGTNLGALYQLGLTSTAIWTTGVTPETVNQDANWQVGARLVFNVSVAPTLTTTNVTNIGSTTATSGGNISSDGGSPVTARGVCWSVNANPTTANSKTTDGTGAGVFTSSITGLSGNTVYHVRAYATNAIGTSYGADIQFITTNPIIAPTVTTTSASQITYSSATVGGNVTSEGGSPATRGVCWSSVGTPTIADNNLASPLTGTGAFTLSMTSLTPNTTYYVRAWSTNIIGTSYGNEITFTTLAASAPSVTTSNASLVTSTTATVGGTYTDTGGSPIIDKGVCWGTNPLPAMGNANQILVGIPDNPWSCNLVDLTPNILYYVRAYARNAVGTTYGNQVTFTTSTDVPDLTLALVVTHNDGTATTGGTIISNNGSPITSKGVCWAIDHLPTIADDKTVDGSGDAAFVSIMSGLQSGSTYRIRSYATNAAGTGYSDEVTVNYVIQVFHGITRARVHKYSVIATAEAPTALAATKVGNNAFIANWTLVWGTVNYFIDVATDDQFVNKVVGYDNRNTGNSILFQIYVPDPDVTYYYRVRSYNGSTVSQNSNTISVHTYPAFTLTASGNGSGVGRLYISCATGTLITLDGNGMFYTDQAGTLNPSKSAIAINNSFATYYVRCNSGTANMMFSDVDGLLAFGNPTSISGGQPGYSYVYDITPDSNNVPILNISEWYYPNCTTICSMYNFTVFHTSISALAPTLIKFLSSGSGSMSGDVSELPNGIELFSTSVPCTITGDVANIPESVTHFQVTFSNTITGDIANLPSSIVEACISGINTIYGNIANVPASIRSLEIQGNNTLTGTLGSLPSVMTNVSISGLNTVSGDISGCPTSIVYLVLGGLNTVSGDIAGIASRASLVVVNISGQNTIYGSISNIPATVSQFTLIGNGMLTGDVATLHAALGIFTTSNNIISGDVINLPRNLRQVNITGQNTITGDVINIPRNMYTFVLDGFNTVYGNFANMPTGILSMTLMGHNTVSDYTSRTWNQLPYYNLNFSPFTGGLSSAEIDQLLIDFTTCAWITSPYFNRIVLGGSNASRTAASDTAVTYLTNKGVILTLN